VAAVDAERRGEDVHDARRVETDKNDFVLEERRIDERLLTTLQLLFRRQQVPDLEARIGPFPADQEWRLVVDQHRELIPRAPRFVRGVRGRYQRHDAIAELDRAISERDFAWLNPARHDRRANTQGRQEAAAPPGGRGP